MLKGFALTSVLSLDGHSVLFGAQDLAALTETGAQVARFAISLGSYPAWDDAILSRYAGVAQQLTAAGLSVIGLLTPGVVAQATQDDQSPLGWNVNNSENSPPGVGGDNIFIGSYAVAAQRIVTALPMITQWEIWNEPNAWGSHSGTVYSGHSFIYPSLYATLLQQTYAAIKAAQPQCTVITGGLLGHNNHGVLSTQNSGADYLQSLYSALATTGQPVAPPWDAVGQHLYMDQAGAVNPAHLQTYLDAIYAVVARNEGAAAARPLYVTEAAWTTAPGAVTPDTQASNLLALYQVCRATPFVAAACWFELRDNPPGNQYYGVYNADWSPKPSYGAFFSS